MSDELFLIDDTQEVNEHTNIWKILVVDDEEAVHTITNVALKNKTFGDSKLEIFNAMSVSQAKTILNEHDDIGLAIIDVVMETPEAGLELVEYIRGELKNKNIRLVLRTGQPSQAPEEEVINYYDINDYKEKTELTSQKLYTLVRTSFKQYIQLKELQNAYNTIYKKMTTSELTSLPNRTKLNECLDSEGKKSLVLININNFSSINQTQGFEAGDKFLKDFAKFLQTKFQDTMRTFHLDGDTFALLCYEKDETTLQECILNLEKDIADKNFNIDVSSFNITISVGIVLRESGNLIQKAQLAINESRHMDKNNTYVYTK